MSDFWHKLKKPFFCLAPMADVTDAAFRYIITKKGKPDILWTEFVSADGLIHPVAKKRLILDLKYSKKEKPIIAQIFGSNPENVEKASKMIKKLGFDGVDINMGCPDRSVCKQGSGAAMMNTPDVAVEVIRAAKKSKLPVSVKTRLGFNKDQLEEWLPILLNENLSAITIHARTKKEMSEVPARWDRVKRAVEIRDEMGKDTLIIGNGDVESMEDARKKVKETGCDGVMIGRGIFGNPWFFSEHEPTLEEKIKTLCEHVKYFDKWVSQKSFAVMKKHFKAYVTGFDGAKELRMKLMETNSAKEVIKVLKNWHLTGIKE